MDDQDKPSDTPQEPGISQRERRRQQYAKNRPKVNLNKQDLKKWTGPLVLLFLVGGVVAITVISDSADEANGCTAHYHYNLDVFVDGDKLVLNPPGDTTFQTVDSSPHMHPTTASSSTVQNLIHNHVTGGIPPGLHPNNCEAYEDAFDNMGIVLSGDALTLRPIHDQIHGDGTWSGTYEEGDGKTLRVFGIGFEDEEWTELDPATLEDFIAPVSSRLAIIYGDEGADVDAILHNQTTRYPAGSYPPDGDPRDPPHYISFEEMRKK